MLARQRDEEVLQKEIDAQWASIMGQTFSSSSCIKGGFVFKRKPKVGGWLRQARKNLIFALRYRVFYSSCAVNSEQGEDVFRVLDVQQDMPKTGDKRPYSSAAVMSRIRDLERNVETRSREMLDNCDDINGFEMDFKKFAPLLVESTSSSYIPYRASSFSSASLPQDASIEKKMEFRMQRRANELRIIQSTARSVSITAIEVSLVTTAQHCVLQIDKQTKLSQQALLPSIYEDLIISFIVSEVTTALLGAQEDMFIDERIVLAVDRAMALILDSFICNDPVLLTLQQRKMSADCLVRFTRRCLDRKHRIYVARLSSSLLHKAAVHRNTILFKEGMYQLIYFARVRNSHRHVAASMQRHCLLLYLVHWKKEYISAMHQRQLAGKRAILTNKEHFQFMTFIRDKAATKIQREFKIMRAQLLFRRVAAARKLQTFVRSIRSYLTARGRRLKTRCISEAKLKIQELSAFLQKRNIVYKWEEAFKNRVILRNLMRVYWRICCRPSFGRWERMTKLIGRLETQQSAAALKLQALYRSHLVRHQFLDYFQWRFRLIRTQAQVRGWIICKYFRSYLRLHRRAILLQKRIRGMLTRMHMKDSWIEALHHAARNNDVYKLQQLRFKVAPELMLALNREGNNLLHSASLGAARKCIKSLLKLNLFEKDGLNMFGFSPLHLLITSAAVQRDECFDYLLSIGFDETVVGPEGATCLTLAASYGRSYIVKQLLEYGMDPNTAALDGSTPLQLACYYDHSAVVDHLLENEACPNQPGALGYYPLHYALESSTRIDLISTLLFYNADINVFNRLNFETVLMTACGKGYEDAVELLLAHSAQAGAIDSRGWTPAHYAASNSSASCETIYQLLLTADVDFNAVDCEGNAPIHIATLANNSVFVKCLLEGGAAFAVKNYQGKKKASPTPSIHSSSYYYSHFRGLSHAYCRAIQFC